MTIYEIKYLTESTAPHFFDRKTLKFFGQTMKSFKVYNQPDGRFLISAPRKYGGYTERYFNPATNKLDRS